MVNIPDDLRAFLANPANRRLELAPGGEIEQLELFSPDQLTEVWFPFRSPRPETSRCMRCKVSAS
jgi:hypothetical protein